MNVKSLLIAEIFGEGVTELQVAYDPYIDRPLGRVPVKFR